MQDFFRKWQQQENMGNSRNGFVNNAVSNLSTFFVERLFSINLLKKESVKVKRRV